MSMQRTRTTQRRLSLTKTNKKRTGEAPSFDYHAMLREKPKSTVKYYLKRYFLDAMSAMALGLFASLLISTIFGTIAKYTSAQAFADIGTYAKEVSGAAIGVAIAYALKTDPLVLLSCAAVGHMGYGFGTTIDGALITAGPAGAFFAVIVAAELGTLVSKKTKVDIIVTPVVTLLAGYGIAFGLSPATAYVMYFVGLFINTATVMQPFLMGVIVSVVVGMVLTLPISSAAICAMIGISGLAGGAAAVGCCCQMVGFAVISFRENRWGGVIAQGLGTSMLQMGNICKNPAVWIAPTLASAVLGPLSTMVFKLQCVGVNAGMGTCGLVGVLGMIDATPLTWVSWLGVFLLCFILPAALSFLFHEIMRKVGLVKTGDLKLQLK